MYIEIRKSSKLIAIRLSSLTAINKEYAERSAIMNNIPNAIKW